MNAKNKNIAVSLTIAGVLVIALAGCSNIQSGASPIAGIAAAKKSSMATARPEGIGSSPDNPYISGE
jgi:hypothetical protein